MRARTARLVALAAALTSIGVVVPQASTVLAAGPFTVNSTADAADVAPGNNVCAAANGACTLRAAVQEASSSTAGTTITLPAGNYVLNSGAGALLVLQNMTLNGAGSGSTVITGVGAGVFDIRGSASSVSISGVKVTGGAGVIGGGIFVDQGVTFRLTDSILDGNNASGGASQGGGMYIYGASRAANVTLTRVTVSNNRAVQGGGIVNSDPSNLTIVDSNIINNAAAGPYAGGIRSNGTLTMTNSNVIGNYAGFGNTAGGPGGGGIYTGNPPAPAAGQVSYFTMNGGALLNNSLPLNLLSSGGGLYNATAGVATLSGVVLSGNSAFHGGGIMSDEAITNVNNSEVRSNTAFYGGGLYNNDFLPGNQFGAYMSIRQSAVYGNTASDSGCPYQIIPSGNLCGAGGGIFNENGDLVVANTTVAQNYAGTFGGGIYNLRINSGFANARLFNATVAANFAVREGGGLLGNQAPFTSKNSIVADNMAAFGPSDCFPVPGSPMYSSGNNITTDGRCGFVAGGDKFGSAQLGALQVYGSGTTTMLPMSGSPALNAGDNAACAASPIDGVDQRGVKRPAGGVCDIGAAEGETARPQATNVARPAVVYAGSFSFRNDLFGGAATSTAGFGLPFDYPLMCDMDGDGSRNMVVVRPTGGYLAWYGKNRNAAGPAEFAFAFGSATDTPVCGDWNGDGVDTPGLMRNVGGARQWFQSNAYGGGGPLNVFYFGAAADQPMHGDWDGNGTDTPGIVRPAGYAMLWSYRNSNSSGITDGEFYFGINTDRPIVGDWDNNGTDTPGVARPEGAGLRWWYRNTIVNGVANGTFVFGGAFDRPLVWKGSGVGGT
ncbi:MAG: CSLREA domain-containing protein [Actinobacteria bacterium]|nr:CSLREA domain-containing protein [Actinomycetota bacterium]